jgi:PadR family transcriptional regulator
MVTRARLLTASPICSTLQKYMGRDHLGEFEQIVLLAVLRLGKNAYGVPVRRQIATRTGREATIGALYSTLDRLEAKGYVHSWFAGAAPERGGRSRRYFEVTAAGVEALRQSKEMMTRMWSGVRLKGSADA